MNHTRDIAALCEVLDLSVEWLEAAETDITGEREALGALRTFVSASTPATAERLRVACVAIYPAEAATGARCELRRALLRLSGLLAYLYGTPDATDAPAALSEVKRQLLGYAAAIGEAVNVKDPVKASRAALDRGMHEGRKASQFPEPAFARQLALGCMIAQLRDLGLVKQADLCRALSARGVRWTIQKLGRLESGVFVKDAPLGAIAACLELSENELKARAVCAHEFARLNSQRFGFDGERWFASMVSEFGETAARAGMRFAAAAAAVVSTEKLRGME